MRVDEIPDGLPNTGPQSVFVRAARGGGDAVHVRADVLVGGLGPLQHQIDAQSFVLVEHERRLVDGLRAPFRDDLLEVIDEALRVLERRLLLRRLVVEHDLDAFVQKAGDLEPILDDLGLELDLREDGGVGPEVHRRPCASCGAQFLQRPDRLALLEPHLPLRAVALDGGDELFRQRVDDARADAVKAAGGFVTAVLEFSAGMKHGEDRFERALLRLRMLVDRRSAPVVFNRDRRTVGVERHADVGGVAVHRLVDGVVEDFPDEVMQPRRPDTADVHAGPFPDRLETLEDGDVFCCVARSHQL